MREKGHIISIKLYVHPDNKHLYAELETKVKLDERKGKSLKYNLNL
jgi:hypothetical protein